MEVLRRRDPSLELVLPSMKGHLRDTGNTEADWRANRDRLGYPGLSSHAFGKACATALDVAGSSSRNTGSERAAAELDECSELLGTGPTDPGQDPRDSGDLVAPWGSNPRPRDSGLAGSGTRSRLLKWLLIRCDDDGARGSMTSDRLQCSG
jgi:hypothetical protein